MQPLYVTEAGGRRVWVPLLMLGGGMAAIFAIWLLVDGAEAGLVGSTAGVTVASGLVLLLIPRRYEVWPDSLTIVFPGWRWTIPFETIEEVRESRSFEPYGFLGFRFATAPSQAVTVIRRDANLLKRPNFVISPREREPFLAHLRHGLQAAG